MFYFIHVYLLAYYRAVQFKSLTMNSLSTGWSFSLLKIPWLWATSFSARHRSTKQQEFQKTSRLLCVFFLYKPILNIVTAKYHILKGLCLK